MRIIKLIRVQRGNVGWILEFSLRNKDLGGNSCAFSILFT